MKRREIGRIVLEISLILLIFLIGCFISFFLTSFIYTHLGNRPSDLLVQIINSFLGLFFAVLIIFLVWFKYTAQYRGAFESIIKTIEKIASGDFNVRMDFHSQDNLPVDKLAKSVNNMALELSQMEKMRQEFISNVSHEIQSPLTSIRGVAEILRNDKLSLEDRLHYLSIIETESKRMSRLSDNLLKLASLESKSIKFEPKLYRLDKQIKDIILACEPQWQDKGIELEVLLDEINIKADEDMMNQVWINLIHNSIKFTPEGGCIRVDLHPKNDKIEVKISDTGIGIAEEDQPYIFERFYMADKSRQRSNKGSGLGLSIVKKIIDIHHGTIDLQSKSGTGATFTISLPAK